MEETGQSRHPPGSPLYDWAEEAPRAPSARVPVSDERRASAPPTREVERRAAGEEQAAPTGPARGNERHAATVERSAAGSASVKMGRSRRASGERPAEKTSGAARRERRARRRRARIAAERRTGTERRAPAARRARVERRPRAERPPRWVVFGLAALILFLGAAALLARDVVRIRDDLVSGQDLLSHLQLTQLDSRKSIEANLGTADRRLRAGASLTRDSIWLKMLSPLPKVGPQIRAARVLSGSAAQVGTIAYQAAVKARTQLDAPRSGPADRLHLVDTLRQDLIDVNIQLEHVPTHTDGHLTNSLAKARTKLIAKLDQAQTQLNDGMAITATLRSMLAGPRTYLVLAGNNAEMRSGGITTAAGLIHFQGGDLNTSQFISSFDLFLPDNKRVPIPPEINHLYGWMQPGQEWRTTDTSPNWPEVAKIYAQMSANSPFGKVDGVLFVDVVTLRSVLSVIGPVTVNGFKYTADNVLLQVLYTNYLDFPTADQTYTRRDVQSNVARNAFSALRGGAFSVPKLAHELETDAKGRHLLAWSADPAEQAMWVKLGADGALGPDDLMVSVQNVSASKLDIFIKPVVNLQVEQFSDRQEINMYVTLANPRRSTTSAYIEGGTPCCVVPGDQRIFLLFYLPATAYNIASFNPNFSTVGTDGGMTVVGMIYIVPYSQISQVHISFLLPLSQKTVNLLPSSRLAPVPFYINDGYRTDDSVRHKIPI